MAAPAKKKRVNVRRPEVMAKVEAEVQNHYNSSLVDRIRKGGGEMTIGKTTIRLAKQFGFCYGVERAIDLAYATRRVFPDNNIFLIGEIIHNQEVNNQLVEMGIVSLPWKELTDDYNQLQADDVVIVPAFGAPTSFMEKIEERGATIVDTTCGDVMKVWRRVKSFAKDGITSVIHGKAGHEETKATASRALGDAKDGHYVVILTLKDCHDLCEMIVNGVTQEAFEARFPKAYSDGFDVTKHLQKVGVANQTTMLKSETEEIQGIVKAAIIKRDGNEDNYLMFDTICGATQERQDALFEMLNRKMDVMLVVGGYNSSNTAHLVEISEEHLPAFFIRTADCLKNLEEIAHYDLKQKEEVVSNNGGILLSNEEIVVGITAGASCPSNLIQNTILRVFELRGTAPAEVLAWEA